MHGFMGIQLVYSLLYQHILSVKERYSIESREFSTKKTFWNRVEISIRGKTLKVDFNWWNWFFLSTTQISDRRKRKKIVFYLHFIYWMRHSWRLRRIFSDWLTLSIAARSCSHFVAPPSFPSAPSLPLFHLSTRLLTDRNYFRTIDYSFRFILIPNPFPY